MLDSHNRRLIPSPRHKLRSSEEKLRFGVYPSCAKWCESTLLEDVAWAVSPLPTQIGVFDFFLAFATSKNAFQKILGNTPSIIFLDLSESELNFSVEKCGNLKRRLFFENFSVQKFMLVENSMNDQNL